MHNAANVTIAFVPRETVSTTLKCLETLIERTRPPYKLIAVAAGYPADLTAEMAKRVDAVGGLLIGMEAFATPNEARNAALAETDTDYIVFVDHDVIVAENWLPPLLACAHETGAAIVAPLVFEMNPPFTRIHMLGGEARLVPLSSGKNAYHDVHHNHGDVAEQFGEPLSRRQTELVEFHAVLVEVAWLRALGGLDPELLSVSEHWDMCMSAARDGRAIYLEPESKVNYTPPARLTDADKRWFSLRWSDEWNRRSLQRLCEKYAIEPGDPSLNGLRGFLKMHKRHRFARLRKKLERVIGAELARFCAHKLVKPAVETIERPRLQRDLARWQETRENRNVPANRRDQPATLQSA